MKIKFLSLLILCLAVTGLQAQVDRTEMPKPGPAPEVNLGTPQTFKLDNGLKVLVVENHKLPHVRARLVLDNEPYSQGEKVGLHSLYSSMMGTGTQNMSKDEFNQRIDFLGAHVGYGSKSARASSLTKFFPEIFELMADGLLHPKFTEDEFETQKKRMIEGIKSSQKSASAIASNVDAALVYGKDHPYGEFATVESVERVRLSDVKSYYNNFITPKNGYLVVVGDMDVADVKKMVKKQLSTWKEETPPSTSLPEVRDVQYTQVNFVDVPNAVQSQVAVMNPVHLKKTDSDYFAALIANQILGGGADGRLFNNLREDKAYTYGAYSSLSGDKYVSDFKASASVRNAVTDSAVVAFLDEIHGMQDGEIGHQELVLAQAKYTGNFVRALEDPSTIARYALNIEMDDLPKDYYQNYLKNIKAVTAEDVLRASKTYFEPNKARIVIVGSGNEVGESLENLTYKGKSIPVKYFDKDANPVEKPDYNKEVPDDVNVKSVYKHYIKAIGGKDAVQKINTLYMKAEGSVGPQSLTLTMKATKDGKTLTEVSMGGNVVQKSVFDGETGYMEMQGQKKDYDEDQIEAAKKEAGLFPELKVPEDAKITGIEQVDGQDAYVVKTSDESSDYYSVESGLKLQTVTKGQMGSSIMSYSDYQAIDGVKYPHTMSRSMGPQSIEFNVQELEFNKNVSDSDFQ